MDFEACWAFSIIAEQTHSNSKRICSWKFPIGHFGAFSQSRHIQSACLLRSSLLGILRPFRKAFRAFFLFEVPYWASCGLFAEQTHSKRLSSSKLPVGNLAAFSQSIQSVFPLRSSLLGILRPFRRADTFKALVFFEAPCWESCGLFAKHSERFSSSKFPIGHLAAFSQSRHIQSACLLRSSLLGILRPFRKAFRAFFLFEVPYWASCGLFAEQTHSKRLSSSKLPVGNLAASSQSRRIQSGFRLRISWGLLAEQTHSKRFCSSKFPIGHLGPCHKADTFETLFFCEVPCWASWPSDIFGFCVPSHAFSSPLRKEPCKFDVPDGERSLLFGSFDNLIRLTDDLAKADSQVDSILHRLERQYVELDPKAAFKVKSQRKEMPVLDYLATWSWDEAKFPKSRSISDTLTWTMSVVNHIDEEARNKTAQFNDFKTQMGSLSKKDAASLAGRDLIDVLTPDKVKADGGPDDDFIVTEHLTTMPVILPRGGEDDFLKVYEKMQENVVPKSARQFKGIEDKDGNTLWRVVMFRSAVEGFKKMCREKRFTVRDFEYSKDGYHKLEQQRKSVEESVKRQRDLVHGLYQASWSDVFVAWMHIKAMRVFVESVLRFGMPPSFAAFILSPKGDATAARKILGETLGKQAGAMKSSQV
ncbi:VHA-C [Symbiodinium natans]|uniref:V-type proton ATPase subunit C n=1 Tax=Symbiodinium natans TaxID=878477 RepID=A0A812JA10_9DINO|nr:VHA-C [Symbiodinium natans]